MAINEMNEAMVSSDIIRPRTGWDAHLSRWLSNIGSPPVLVVGMTIMVSAVSAKQWGVTAVYLLLTLDIPFTYIGYLVKQGKAADFDVSVRRQRIIPLFVALVGSGLGLLLFTVSAVPSLLTVLAVSNFVITLLLAIVTMFWKISIHSATAAAGAVAFWMLSGNPIFFLSIPCIAWSRVRLRRHTLSQTAAGAALGSIIPWVIFSINGG